MPLNELDFGAPPRRRATDLRSGLTKGFQNIMQQNKGLGANLTSDLSSRLQAEPSFNKANTTWADMLGSQSGLEETLSKVYGQTARNGYSPGSARLDAYIAQQGGANNLQGIMDKRSAVLRSLNAPPGTTPPGTTPPGTTPPGTTPPGTTPPGTTPPGTTPPATNNDPLKTQLFRMTYQGKTGVMAPGYGFFSDTRSDPQGGLPSWLRYDPATKYLYNNNATIQNRPWDNTAGLTGASYFTSAPYTTVDGVGTFFDTRTSTGIPPWLRYDAATGKLYNINATNPNTPWVPTADPSINNTNYFVPYF